VVSTQSTTRYGALIFFFFFFFFFCFFYSIENFWTKKKNTAGDTLARSSSHQPRQIRDKDTKREETKAEKHHPRSGGQIQA
jgi:hypothetical protein